MLRLRALTAFCFLLATSLWGRPLLHAQDAAPSKDAELRLQLTSPHGQKQSPVPAVLWLEPLSGTPASPLAIQGPYSLVQKNRVFLPHLLVVPVGSVVQFPNKDPFFHNVFSLFEGKRFDLGLYEAGSSKSVTFSREGVSYIFCNIHPEMSAVVISLSTSLYAIADAHNSFRLSQMPAGDYQLHIWIQGIPPAKLDGMTHVVHMTAGMNDLGTIPLAPQPANQRDHTNEYGKPYSPTGQNPY